MPVKKHLFVSCTKNKKEDTVFYQCIHDNTSLKNIKIIWFENNTTGLSKRYNEALKKFKHQYDYIHFIHDDVYLYDDLGVLTKILDTYNFAISGAAGAKSIKLVEPFMWHAMSNPHSAMGVVEHGPVLQSHISTFGVSFDKAVILDGLYLCVNTSKINNWCFNENFDFHFYDIASCIDAFKQNIVAGVIPIHLRHECILYNPLQNKSWIDNNNKFKQLYVTK